MSTFYFEYYSAELRHPSLDAPSDSRLEHWYRTGKEAAQRAPSEWIERLACAWIIDFAVEGAYCNGLGPEFEGCLAKHPDLYGPCQDGPEQEVKSWPETLQYDWMVAAAFRDHLLDLIQRTRKLRGRLEFLRRLLQK